jgi:AraC-like DNA-binding protein
MPKSLPPLTETHIDGPRSRLRVVTAADCPALRAHHLAHAGIVTAQVPFARVRTEPDGSFLLACFAGEGRILLDGRWQRCTAGMICLAPPRALDAFHAVSGKPWHFAYLRYHEMSGQRPLVTAASPVRVRGDAEAFRLATEGLLREVQGANDARLVHHWVELLHGLAVRVAQPWQVNPRLWAVWEQAGQNLAANWDVTKLAKLAHYSGEHLRRLCLRELGRTPMQQLTYMRLQHAAELLGSTTDKLETIAAGVGYSGAFAFSKVFKKWFGVSPSEFRERGLG